MKREGSHLDESWDVVVVGAGPAGALAARELARNGARVLLLDRASFPRWKVCGTCLSPGAQEALRLSGLGALPDRLGAVPLEHLHLTGWSRSARVPLQGTLALSRKALDLGLIQAAEDSGAQFLPKSGARWAGVSRDWARLGVNHPEGALEVKARVVVAADGLRSGILAGAGLRGDSADPPGVKVGLGAVLRGGEEAYGPGIIHMVLGREGYVGMARTEEGLLNVAAAVERKALASTGSPARAVERILSEAGAPALEGEVLEGWKGTPALGYRPRALGGDRVLAVGDAAGFVEPFTGEGMGWALAGARALAPVVLRALDVWTPEIPRVWEDVFAGSVGRAQRLSRAMAWTLRQPLPARGLMSLLEPLPQVARPFVSMAANPPSLHRTRSRRPS